MTLRLGLAGLGIHGRRYTQHLLARDVPGARLVAVSRHDRTAGRAFADRHGLRFFGDPRELAACDAVDGVVLVLPPDLHGPAAEACLAAGKPVLVEKPMAHDLPAAVRLVEQVEQRAGFLMVAQTLRFDPLVRALRREASTLGPLRVVSLNQRFEPSDRPWIDTPGRGGMFLNTGVHGFDLIRYLTGLEPESIQADAGRALTRRTEDQFVALIRLEPGGVLAAMDNARSTRARSGRIELVGEQAQVWGDHIHRTLCRVRGHERQELGPIAPRPTVPATLDSFVTAVTRQTPPEVTARDGLATLEMIEAARRSDRTGRRVALREVRRPA